ncbi:MAG: glycosyl transferase, family 39 [Pseudonocardiaceae bacterium]|nr:glycosyl transferase, family 39 [Pseudonocardiaceae bacterium]
MASLDTVEKASASQRIAVSTLARGPVFAIAGALGALLLVLSGRYGYFGDELYFLAAGRHLAWGYADQPPVLPLLARAMDTVVPGSVTVLRLPATLATAAGVVIAALIARELGGRRKAQLLTAGAFAVSSGFLSTGHYLATSTIDPFLWTVLLWLIVRWIRTRSDGLLVWAGVVTAVAINVKFLVLGFWLVAGICLLIFGPRELLRRPLLLVGALIALAATVPTAVWQATNGWPQLDMNAAISREVDEVYGGRLVFLPGVVLTAGLLVGAVLLVYGWWQLLHSEQLRPYRFLGWTTLGLVLLFIVLNGRSYYVAGMYPLCWAAAAVTIERRQPARWWRWVPTWPVCVVSFLITVPLALPIWPASWVKDKPAVPKPLFAGAEIGWPEFTDSVATVYRGLPPDRRRHTAIVTETYWQASAISQFGPERGLGEAFSGNRGYWTLGEPPESATDVLFVGNDRSRLRRNFAEVRRIRGVHTGLEFTGFSQSAPVWLATGRAEPWSTLWPRFSDLDVAGFKANRAIAHAATAIP